ncbi:MAG: Gfo/Idh/MocA family protein [Planctomycetaceae bacterium]|jgi:predicted dehydrogenase
MLRIGIIGLGFMGMTHFEAARRLKGARVAAFATRDPKKLAGDWTSIQGNFGPRGERIDLKKLKVTPYADHRELIADPQIDLVDVCLPNDQHEQVVCEALKAGKHVLVEKPIAVDLKAADRMVAAAAKARRMLLVAHVLPFFPEFKYVVETVRSGRFGKLRAAHFRRVICTPDWSSDMADLAKTGGPGVDLHIHDTHFISHLCGVPQAVHTRGIVENGWGQHLETQYLYKDTGLAVSCTSGGIAAKGLAFAHGFEIYLEKATLLYDFNTLGGQPVMNRPLTLVTNDGKATQPTLKAGTEWCAAFTAELQTAVAGLVNNEAPPLLSGELARDALKLCHLEVKSALTGKVVAVR